MELVHIVAGGLTQPPVDGDAVPHLILDNQHTELLQLLAQLLDVVADNAVVDIHIGAVVEHIEGAGDVDLQRRGDELRLLFLLRPQGIIEIAQDGHILRPGVGEILLIDLPHTAVYHRFSTGWRPSLLPTTMSQKDSRKSTFSDSGFSSSE